MIEERGGEVVSNVNARSVCMKWRRKKKSRFLDGAGDSCCWLVGACLVLWFVVSSCSFFSAGRVPWAGSKVVMTREGALGQVIMSPFFTISPGYKMELIAVKEVEIDAK